MKIFKYSALVLIIFIAISCKGKPKIQFKETLYDFGDQKTEQNLKHTFTFTNVGTSTLIIEKVRAG